MEQRPIWDCWNDREDFTFDCIEGQLWSVANMTDEEVRESIVSDMLTLLEFGVGGVKWDGFFRFLRNPAQRTRVLDALLDLIGSGLVRDSAGFLHLGETRAELQFTMDFAGVWWKGFDPPPGVAIIRMTDAGRELVEGMGINGAAHYLHSQFLHPDTTRSLQ